MNLKPLPQELNELRSSIISSNFTTCYLILDELITSKGDRLFYDKFRREWMDVYKEVYNVVSKMKARRSLRGDTEMMKMAHQRLKRETK